MKLKTILDLFPKDTRIFVVDEFGRELFRGPIWTLDSKYLLSCFVVDCKRSIYLTFTVVY